MSARHGYFYRSGARAASLNLPRWLVHQQTPREQTGNGSRAIIDWLRGFDNQSRSNQARTGADERRKA